jgi:methyltransferase (TIGR00027 family)
VAIMKKEKSSKTADQMALSRAIESLKSGNERICFDRYAKDFLSNEYSRLIRSKIMRLFTIWLMERLFPGHYYYVVARSRYIDDYLQENITSGIKQLVIIGAGLDSRPYRFDDLKKIKVYEVDHPATQSIKKKKVKNTFGAIPEHVVFVAVDFNDEQIDVKLLKSGYDKNLKTLFIWEGTTPYINLEAVHKILEFISAESGAGSSIIFDYILSSVVNGTCMLEGARNELKKMAKTDEPFILGFEKDEIDLFLKEKGFNNIKDAGADYFKSVYFDNKYPKRKIKPWWRIVHAVVGKG